MSQVIFKKASYDYQALKSALFEMIRAIEDGKIKRQARVLIKPNLLMPATPEHAILTHPLIVKAIVEYVLDKGGRPLISDSPAMGSFEKIKKQGGYQKVLRGLEVEFKAFNTSIKKDIGEPFGSIELAREAVRW